MRETLVNAFSFPVVVSKLERNIPSLLPPRGHENDNVFSLYLYVRELTSPPLSTPTGLGAPRADGLPRHSDGERVYSSRMEP